MKTTSARRFELRKLIFAALMTALAAALSGVFITVGESLRIQFTFLPMALCGAVCGPISGLLAGIAADLVGFLIFPSGPFFLGYTISAACGGLFYGLFLFRRVPSLSRVLVCRTAVNVFVNIGLGSLWRTMILQGPYYLYLWPSAVKNCLLLLVEVPLLLTLLNVIWPALVRFHWVENEKNHVKK